MWIVVTAGLFLFCALVLIILHKAVQCIVSLSVRKPGVCMRGSDLSANITVWSARCCVQTLTVFVSALVFCHCCCIWRLCLLQTCCHVINQRLRITLELYMCLLIRVHHYSMSLLLTADHIKRLKTSDESVQVTAFSVYQHSDVSESSVPHIGWHHEHTVDAF